MTEILDLLLSEMEYYRIFAREEGGNVLSPKKCLEGFVQGRNPLLCGSSDCSLVEGNCMEIETQ